MAGNIAALTVAANELAVELDAPIATATYWLLAQPAFANILEKQANVRHACEAETSMVLALKPELVDMSLVARRSDRPNANSPTSSAPRRRIAGNRSSRGPGMARSAIRAPRRRRKASGFWKPPLRRWPAL